MTREMLSDANVLCDKSPGNLDNPRITKTITIKSTVTRTCEVLSDLEFSVPTLLSEPEILEADDHVLHLGTFTGDATVFVKKWSFMEVGHSGCLAVNGTLKDGSPYTVGLMIDEPITAQEVENGISRALAREELERFRHDSPLTVVFKTTVDACCEEGTVVVFPVLKVTVIKPLTEIGEFFEEQEFVDFSAGGSIDTPTMRIKFESGTDTAGIMQFHDWEGVSGKHYVMSTRVSEPVQTQIHRFNFKHDLLYLRFAWMSKQMDGAVSYYELDGSLLERFEYPGAQLPGFWLEYVPPLGKTVSSIMMEVNDYTFVDNFTMRYYD